MVIARNFFLACFEAFCWYWSMSVNKYDRSRDSWAGTERNYDNIK